MASETSTPVRLSSPVEFWPPHDTEESIWGTDLHQTTITNLRLGLNEVAHLHRVPGQPVPWQALSQITLLGCAHPGGSMYRTYPDVFVYPHPVDPQRGSLSVAVDGPPRLIIEVLSESTYEADMDLVRGKGYSYAHAGVHEYLVLDPSGLLLADGILGWRLQGGVYHPWRPAADGRWHSSQFAVALGLEGMQATVYTPEGQRLLHEGEIEEERARLHEERARLHAEIARRDAELERLRRLLDARGEPLE